MWTSLNKVRGLLALMLMMAVGSAWATPATSYFIYDESGHVIGEYDANGNPIQEHVYLGDRSVAVVQGGSAGTVDYVSTDQLNTPRMVTDGSKVVLWSWNSDPFGNASSMGSLTYNLRFPGQYYDAETGHNYNIYRDYDASTGRYIESDPSGLDGGLNTYTYVEDDPLDWFDKFGLYGLKAGVPAPSTQLDRLLTCIEGCYKSSFTVTSTTDSHDANTPHGRGVAADIRMPADPTAFLCCAGQCGAGFALDESQHPSPHANGAHIHVQIPPGRHGGHGDIPPPSKCDHNGCH